MPVADEDDAVAMICAERHAQMQNSLLCTQRAHALRSLESSMSPLAADRAPLR